MTPYTEKQHLALEIIRQTIEERGIAPTLEEIGFEMGGITRVAVLDHLRALERKGAIRRKAREARSIVILDPDHQPIKGIPLVGTIAAGEPILEVEDREDVTLNDYLGVAEGCFLLRVEGDSMIEAHIMSGDLVLVEAKKTARNGETVVAVVGEETTLKRLFREKKGMIRLQPANGSLKPRRYRSSEVKIRGIVRGVVRRT